MSLQYVELSPWGFALWWLFLLLLHHLAFGYSVGYAVFYYELQDTYLYLTLEYAGIPMLAKEHHTVIVSLHAVLAVLHGLCIILMVGSSLSNGKLQFSPSMSENKRATTSAPSRLQVVKNCTIRLYSRVWGREGVFGVNGSNFHAILITRELVETTLQTVQAYRMSWHLPRASFNRFYLVLLVLNCWSSVLVHSPFFRRSEARRRFICLVCDCILDLVSCIGIPLLVVLSYASEYDPQLTGFGVEQWYDDVWSARVVNEFQMVLVSSWSDLISSATFSCGVIAATTGMKRLLRRIPVVNRKRVACAANCVGVPAREKNLKAVGPVVLDSLASPENSTCGASNYGNAGRRGQVVLHAIHLMFWLWGVVVLGLHIQASTQPEVPQCVLQVHPWAVSEPACYLAVLDCYRLEITGKLHEIEDKWREFDKSTVVTLVIRHCPVLEIPDMIADFHSTTGIKVYNSSINQWGPSAALTNANHPELIWLLIVRVKMTDGVLPLGIQSADFPAKLYDLEFYDTNVRELPDDLDAKWFPGSTIYCEYCQLASVPEVLWRLHPYSIALTGNAITKLPPEIFEIEGLAYLNIGSLPIQELPRNVTKLSPEIQAIVITNTNVSFFWQWIDPMVERRPNEPYKALEMSGSRYCLELGEILDGEADGFSVVPPSEYVSILMDPSDANREIILHTVNCEPGVSKSVYPIEFEDRISALP